MIGAVLLAIHFLAVCSTLPVLPDETNAHISSYLDYQSLVRYLASSKTRRDLREWVKMFDADYSANQLSNDFSFLSGYPNLEEIYLKRPRISSVSFLPRFTRLRVVDLTGYFNAFDFCSLLPSSETLEVVRLWRLTPDSPQCLRNFRKLKKLYVNNLNDLSILQGLESLEELEIFGSWTTTLEPLVELNRLKILKIHYAQNNAFTFLGLDALHATLEELDVYGVRLRTMTPIGNLSGLRRLNVQSDFVISDLVSELGKLTQLLNRQIRTSGLGGYTGVIASVASVGDTMCSPPNCLL
jgi:Leucine-rich repeat (LRR) protein